MRHLFVNLCLLIGFTSQGQSKLQFFQIGDINVTVDSPIFAKPQSKTIIIFYALPNGNTTAQTMGKKIKAGDDWHFDIQHIQAQTNFIRHQLKNKNIIVIYLENNYLSWPLWKQKNADYKIKIPLLVDSIASVFSGNEKIIYLNGHSGGGSFIFGYLDGIKKIPSYIRRISFLDSDYGYDSSYYHKLNSWLTNIPGTALNVFAYNDSLALYNGKPLVSATGGTWYRSHLLLSHLQKGYTLHETKTDSLIIFKTKDKRIQFFFKLNLNQGIYHTQQVELNGFIHSVLCGTGKANKKYSYYGKRAYTEFIH